MEKRYCACGCGGEVKIWKNKRSGPFLRGHHMRKREYIPPSTGSHYCKCGCGCEIKPLPTGHIRDYILNHHRKGIGYTFEERIERMRSRWKREPILSPYLENTFISFDKKQNRWRAYIRKNNKSSNILHAKLVYQTNFGPVPKGYVVHHKDGKHEKITDDRPENLMLLLDEWNLRFFPSLAKGFGVPEKVVTDAYCSIFAEELTSVELFAKLCQELINITNISHEKLLAGSD